MDETRRWKIASVDKGVLVEMFNWHANEPEWIALPVRDDLPDGCRVKYVAYNHERDCLDFVVEHESFDEIPNCMVLPRLDDAFTELRMVRGSRPPAVHLVITGDGEDGNEVDVQAVYDNHPAAEVHAKHIGANADVITWELGRRFEADSE